VPTELSKKGVVKIKPRLQPSKKALEERRLRTNERRRLARRKARLEVLKAQRTELQNLLPKPEPTKKKFKLRFNRHPKAKPVQEIALDMVEEQVDRPMVTRHCPESVKEDDLTLVKKEPEQYIEINIIEISRVVDAFYIPANRKTFHYKKKEYKVNEEAVYLLPTKSGAFMPTCYYRENNLNPTGFKNTNKGITGKAMSLLYMEQLYTSLLYSEDQKYNLFIVILSIAILIAYGIGMYFTFMHGGGIFKPAIPDTPLPAALIRIGGGIFG
jgi:hypothetical protein